MILCCGEALIDMVPGEAKAGSPNYNAFCGGAVFNTAIALGRLGVETGLLSGLSSDLFGDQLRLSLIDSNVESVMSIVSNRPTSLTFVKLDNGQATYTFYDENSAGRMLYAKDVPEIPDGISNLCFGGISLISEPCAEFYETLAIRKSADNCIFIDPNVRVQFIQDEQRYRERLARFIKHCDMIKVSDEDLDWIKPGPGTIQEKARMLREDGPQLVIVTNGAEGAFAITPLGDLVEVEARPVDVADTVGAGDTFNAGVLAKLVEIGLATKSKLNGAASQQIAEALKFGTAVAAITVSRSGVNPPWAREIEGA